MDTTIESLSLYHEALWLNVTAKWKMILLPFWLTLPLFVVASLLVEAATAEKENRR